MDVELMLSHHRAMVLLTLLLGVIGSLPHAINAFVPSRHHHYRPLPLSIRRTNKGLHRHDKPRIPSFGYNFHTQLTTKENSGDEAEKKINPFRKAANKFRARPGTYLIIPCVAALVGWVTNWMAVQMIFYPIHFRGIPLYIKKEVPLGLLGWQGIVPCKTRPMSEAMVDMVTSQLLSLEEAFGRLDPRRVAKLLSPEVPKMAQGVASDLLPKWVAGVPKAVFLGLDRSTKAVVGHLNYRFLYGFTVAMQKNIGSLFNIRNCVVTQMLQDRTLLGQLFRKCGQKELDFLTNSGLWFGFLLGIIQMIVALFWDNPWSLSIGGLIVGYATNWLALKWIFEPVNPTKVGPFVLQGQFLRRQKEVSAEFSKFFANKVLTSEKVWDSILTDPETTPAFHKLFRQHFTKFVNKVTGGLGIKPEPEVVALAASDAITKLPNHVGVLHDYVDSTLGLEDTLRVRMEQMTSSQFERVLHPIFEEDELTLILAGAALGFAAGLIQQGLETGKIQLPDTKKLVQQVREHVSHPRQTAKAVAKATKARVSTIGSQLMTSISNPRQTAKDIVATTQSRVSNMGSQLKQGIATSTETVKRAAKSTQNGVTTKSSRVKQNISTPRQTAKRVVKTTQTRVRGLVKRITTKRKGKDGGRKSVTSENTGLVVKSKETNSLEGFQPNGEGVGDPKPEVLDPAVEEKVDE